MKEEEEKNSKLPEPLAKVHNTPIKKRLEYIDVARGIAILLMIVGHVLGGGWKRNIIFSFHMPLFIIISGLFFKENEKFTLMLKKSLKTLMIPFLVVIFLDTLFKYFMNNQNLFECIIDFFKRIIFSYSYGNKISYDSVAPLGVMWFVPFLFVIKIIFWGVNKIAKDNEILKFLLSILIMIFGYYLGVLGYWLPFSLDIAMFSIIFMYVGYVLKKYNLLEKILQDYKILFIILIIWVIGIKYSSIELAIRLYPKAVLSVITAICGTIIVFKISNLIDLKLKKLSKILQWYGRNSMIILGIHHLEYSYLNGLYFQISKKIVNNHLYKAIVSITKILTATVGLLLINLLKKLCTYIKNKIIYKQRLKIEK